MKQIGEDKTLPLLQGNQDERKSTYHEAGVVTKPKEQLKRPGFYRVLLLNDDYTPMDFVVYVLERFFRKSREDALRIMLRVHHSGVGECGIFTYEVAEAKVVQVMNCAKEYEHPLQCVMEKK